MAITVMVLILAAAAMFWLQAAARPQPVRVRRNPVPRAQAAEGVARLIALKQPKA